MTQQQHSPESSVNQVHPDLEFKFKRQLKRQYYDFHENDLQLLKHDIVCNQIDFQLVVAKRVARVCQARCAHTNMGILFSNLCKFMYGSCITEKCKRKRHLIARILNSSGPLQLLIRDEEQFAPAAGQYEKIPA